MASVEESKFHSYDLDRHLASQGATQDSMSSHFIGHVTAKTGYVRRSALKARGALRDMTHSNCNAYKH